jgi:hypothetical protein
MSWVQAAEAAVREQEHFGMHMKYFGPSPDAPASVCRATVKKCDVWVGLLADNHGSLVPAEES